MGMLTSLLTLASLGAYHGLSPGMGWLFAVALALQERSGRVIPRALCFIALGHALSVGLSLGLLFAVQAVLPLAELHRQCANGVERQRPQHVRRECFRFERDGERIFQCEGEHGHHE